MNVARLVLSTMVLLGQGCAGIHAISKADVRTMTLLELLGEVAQKKETFQLPEHGLVVRVPQGSTLPLKLAVSTPFATVEQGDNRVRFDRDVYLYIQGHTVAISPDGERWADLGDWKSMKRLFGAGRGDFSLGAGILKEQGAIISASLRFERP